MPRGSPGTPAAHRETRPPTPREGRVLFFSNARCVPAPARAPRSPKICTSAGKEVRSVASLVCSSVGAAATTRSAAAAPSISRKAPMAAVMVAPFARSRD
eukprot:6668357-Pyramimonas_sp.AAC.1